MKSNTIRSFLILLCIYLFVNILVSLFWVPKNGSKDTAVSTAIPLKYVGISKDKSGNTQYWIAASIYKTDSNTFTIVLGNDRYIEVTSDYFIKVPIYKDSEVQTIKTQYGLSDNPTQ